MAKETKAERTARETAVREAMMEEQRATYPARLLAMLERAQDANFELRVKCGMYTLFDRDDSYSDVVLLVLTPFYTDESEEVLDGLVWVLESKEEAEKEANRKQLARQTALAKLSKEEKELLGL